MKKLLTFTSAVFLCFIFSGCPYESKVPLDKAKEKINQNLRGTWNEEHFEFKISKLNEFTYLLWGRDKFTNEIEDTVAAYITTLNGITFLNVYDYNPDGVPEKYHLYKMEMNGDKQVKIFPVTDDIKNEFSTSDSLKIFIVGNMKHDGFFEEPWILTRIK